MKLSVILIILAPIALNKAAVLNPQPRDLSPLNDRRTKPRKQERKLHIPSLESMAIARLWCGENSYDKSKRSCYEEASLLG